MDVYLAENSPPATGPPQELDVWGAEHPSLPAPAEGGGSDSKEAAVAGQAAVTGQHRAHGCSRLELNFPAQITTVEQNIFKGWLAVQCTV